MQKISSTVTDLHNRFSLYGRNAREWTRRCILLLPEIERERVWEKKGFESIYVYAAKLAGMSRNAVDDALRILEKIEYKPALQQVVEQKGLNAVRPVIAIATPETELFWAEKAMTMSKNTLEAYVREFRTSTGNNADLSHNKAITMELDPEIAKKLEQLKDNDDWNTLMSELLEMREKMLSQQKPEQKLTNSRHIPDTIKRFIIQRSRGFCEFRNCKRKYEILHHTQRFALEKVHDPSRIVALCKAHERIVHLGLIEDEKIQTSEWNMIKRADPTDPRYAIDRLVAKYRIPS